MSIFPSNALGGIYMVMLPRSVRNLLFKKNWWQKYTHGSKGSIFCGKTAKVLDGTTLDNKVGREDHTLSLKGLQGPMSNIVVWWLEM